PGLRVLATSRMALRVAGEHEMRLAPLPIPRTADAPADELLDVASVCLFLDRARAVRPDLPSDDATIGAVGAVCRALDGLPLVVAEPGPRAMRYRFLETVRVYALERLDAAGESEALRKRHAAYYTALVEGDRAEQRFRAKPEVLDRQEPERDNLRAGLAWYVA